MYAAAIILFREILEIVIILSVVMAACRGVKNRGAWISAGLFGGVVGSAAIAYFTDAIADWVSGMGQEVFNAGILLVAVAMIGWTVVWMKQHGRQLVARLKNMGEQVQQGDIPMAALALVVCLSVWREGAEIVLFMYGIISTAEESLINLLIGGAGGATAAAILGTMMYLGLLRVPMKYFFTVTEWMLILVACGLSAQAAGYLTAANILPTLINEMWDSSQLLPETNIIGQILHALIGYTDRPSGMQMVFYLSTLTIIMISARVVNAIHTKPKKEAIIHP